MTYEREHGRGVDVDLLADYIGGALDGTPEAATVERLITDDPAWARAYAETSVAIDAVRLDMSTLGAVREQMPADVVSRLDTALAAVLPNDSGKVIEFTPPRSPARSRRWVRRFAPVAVAAGVLICVGLGGTLLRQSSGSDAGSSTNAGGRAAAPAAGEPQFSAKEAAPQVTSSDLDSAGPLMQDRTEKSDSTAGPPVVATGTDYTRGTLPELSAAMSRSSVDARSGAGAAVPAQLERLSNPAALDICLAAIKAAGAPPAATVRVVDLASFQGSPAVVVVFADWIWVSGPDCGLGGPDTKFTTRTR